MKNTLFALLCTSLLLFPVNLGAQDCPIKHPALTALDHTSMAAAITASFRGLYGRNPTGQPGSGSDDINYWIAVSDHYGPFSDGVCRAGWSAYWELKLGGTDSANPALGDQPARFQPATPVVEPPQPPVVIPPTPVPVAQLDRIEDKIDALAVSEADFHARVGIAWRQVLTFVAKYGGPVVAAFVAGKKM